MKATTALKVKSVQLRSSFKLVHKLSLRKLYIKIKQQEGSGGGGKTIQVEMSTYLNTYDVDTMEVITARILPSQGAGGAVVDMMRYQTTAMRYQTTAMRYQTTAMIYQTTAMRYQTTAMRYQITAMIYQTTAMR